MSRLAAPILLLLATMACATASARTTPTSEPTASPAHEDVEFHSLGITLSGTIFVPAKTVAAVVLVDGAGKTLRKTGLARPRQPGYSVVDL